MTPLWLWAILFFVFGSCIGSFLNVVIWRIPRNGSIWRPAQSYCPHCEKPIAWYDNIPLLSWAALGAKCRRCGGGISARYPLVELTTALLFLGLLLGVYAGPLRPDLGRWPDNWPGYLAAVVLGSGLLAVSVIDLEHYFIPIGVVWFGGIAAVVLATVFPGPWLPRGTPGASAWGVGGGVGLGVAILLLRGRWIPLSFAAMNGPEQDSEKAARPAGAGTSNRASKKAGKRRKNRKGAGRDAPTRTSREESGPNPAPPRQGHSGQAGPEPVGVVAGARREVTKELLFLLPIVLFGWLWWGLTSDGGPLEETWRAWCRSPHLRGLGGSMFGLLVGGGFVWGVRILGTWAFGQEAMGLGDVHLLGAAGALLGWLGATLAFFIAPGFGLAVAMVQFFRHGRREVPFGPYLSLGVLTVILYYDRLDAWLSAAFVAPPGP